MKFDKRRFVQALLDAPKEAPLFEPSEHSDYLQKQVFDKLAAGEKVDLRSLDWTAFDLRHVTPAGYAGQYERPHRGWLQDINHFLHKIPATNSNEKRFF